MIGIFDSGSGGLTVLEPLRKRLPGADVVYFGDIANAPYGNRTQTDLTRLTVEAIRLLIKEGATSIVSACNSLSASLSLSLFDMLDFAPERLIEMVGPTAASLRDSNERLLLCATAATIRSEIYQSAFRMLGKDIQTLALPELAGAIEEGKPEAEIEAIIRKGFASVDTTSFDAVILSCTHYPLVLDVFKRVLPEHIRLINPGEAVAARAARDWKEEKGNGTLRLLISRDSSRFRELAEELFSEESYTVEVISPQP
jgi:glutamate racemase